MVEQFTLEELQHMHLCVLYLWNYVDGEGCEICASSMRKMETMILELKSLSSKPIIEERIIGGHKVKIEHSKV